MFVKSNSEWEKEDKKLKLKSDKKKNSKSVSGCENVFEKLIGFIKGQ